MCQTIAAIFFLVSLVFGFVAKTLHKKRMTGALGRKATDQDLSSFGSWMKVSEAEEKSAAVERKNNDKI